MEKSDTNLWTVISSLSKEINNIKSHLCPNCDSLGDVKFFKGCGHVGCVKCLTDSKIICPQCKRKSRKGDVCKYDTLDAIVSNIQELNKVKTYLKGKAVVFNILICFQNKNVTEQNSTNVVTFFTPESTITKRDYKGETRLHKDCRDGKLDKVETLLKAGVDVNAQDFAGWTALHEAVMAQKIDIARLLLDYGAFVNVPGPNYETPLHVAIQKQNVSLAKLLVEYGADLMTFDKDGKTPMDLCIKSKELKTALCLTPTRPTLYKIYTIPISKVFYRNISNEYYNKLLNLPGVTICTEHNLLNIGDVTYFVIENDNKFNVKHLQAAILQGSCVVNATWIDDTIAKKSVLNPIEYIIPLTKYALQKAFMNALNKLPKLFDGLQFYFCHNNFQNVDNHKYTIVDLKTLIHLGGGRVLARRPHGLEAQDVYYPYHSKKNTTTSEVSYYLIYDEERPNCIEHTLFGAMYKPTKWLIDCINSFSIID